MINGKVQNVTVEIGLSDDDNVEIINGLNIGDQLCYRWRRRAAAQPSRTKGRRGNLESGDRNNDSDHDYAER